MKHNHIETCILGEGIVTKLLSVLDSDLVSNFPNDKDAESSLIAEINERIKSACDLHLNSVVQRFFSKSDAVATALAFDVIPDHIEALKQGFDLKSDRLLTCTRKILVLVAMNTHTTPEELNNMVQDVISTHTNHFEHYPTPPVEAA